jgi:hypothetical protein
MPSNVFYPSLNDFCTKYLVLGPKPLNRTDMQQFPARDAAERAALFEHLLLFDTVSIKLHGENVPLALMLRLFGEKGLEALIEQEAVRFVLWTPTVLHNVTEMPGVNALMSGNLNSPAHSDPEQSFDLGLNWLTEKPPKYLRRRLKKKVLPLYEIPPPDLAAQTVALANSAFASGKLTPLGFDPEKQRIDNLTLAERALFSKCASDLLDYRYLLSRRMTAMSSFEYFSLFSNSLQHIETSGKVVQGFGELAELENMPDLKALFPTLQDGLKQLPRLRDKRKSRKFREWLSSTTSGDKNITAEYLAAITEAEGPLNTKTGKFFNALALVSVGATVGHAAEGALPGALAGGLIAQVAAPAVEFTLDLLDEFLLDGLRKGWQPRMFFNDLRKLEKSEPAQQGPRQKSGPRMPP